MHALIGIPGSFCSVSMPMPSKSLTSPYLQAARAGVRSRAGQCVFIRGKPIARKAKVANSHASSKFEPSGNRDSHSASNDTGHAAPTLRKQVYHGDVGKQSYDRTLHAAALRHM